ncbi:MAG: HAMP domain-containing protein, partial [Deltaproteobacteria bacterium]|nr:HAMP domain-containing protein [Deltaproteobacteria bacterium]
LQANTMHLLEALASYQMIRASAAGPEDLELQREYQEAVEIQKSLMAATEFYLSQKSTVSPEIIEVAKHARQLAGLSDELLRMEDITSRFAAAKRAEIEGIEKRFLELSSRAIESEMIAIRSSIDSALIDSGNATNLIRIAALTMIILAIINAIILSYMLTRPIAKLNFAVNRLMKGDFECKVPVSGHDEVARLSRAFNQMAENLARTTVSADYHESIIDSIQEPLLVLNAELDIISSNRAFEAVTKRSLKEAETYNADAVLSCEEFDRHRLNPNLLLGRTVEGFLRGGENENIPVSMTLSSLRGSENRSARYVLLFQDLRDRKRIENNISLYRERIRRAETLASLGTLGAIVAHKLNQPLTSIRLFLQQSVKMINGLTVPKELNENLSDSLQEIEKASRAVQEVLQMTKYRSEEPASLVSLQQSASNTLQALKNSADKAGLIIKISGLESLPQIKARPFEIEELFYILMNNSIQALKPGGSGFLTISGEESDKNLTLRFEDDCGGIPPELERRLFTDYITTKAPGEGSGLGLHILKQIVTDHGGKVSVLSRFGEGTSFVIELPKAPVLIDSEEEGRDPAVV